MPKPSKQKSVGGVGSFQVFVFGVGSEGLLAECSAQREDPPRNGFLFDKVPFDHSLHSLHNQQTLGGGGGVLCCYLYCYLAAYSWGEGCS